MSGIKLSCPFYYSHYSHVACVCLLNNFEVLFVFVLIWSDIWVQKWYFLEELIKIYYLEIWIYLVRYLTQDLRPSTLSFIRPVYLKIVYHKCEAFLCDLLLDMRFVLALYHTPYVYLATNNYIPHLARECPVLVHLGPIQGISARTSPCRPFQWPRHSSAWFVQWSNKLHIWYQMNFIWCKNCFLKAYLQIYFFTCFIIYFPWS